MTKVLSSPHIKAAKLLFLKGVLIVATVTQSYSHLGNVSYLESGRDSAERWPHTLVVILVGVAWNLIVFLACMYMQLIKTAIAGTLAGIMIVLCFLPAVSDRPSILFNGQVRHAGVIDNPNLFGVLAAATMLFVLLGAVEARKAIKAKRVPSKFATCFELFVAITMGEIALLLIESYSRSGLMAFTTGIAFLLIRSRRSVSAKLQDVIKLPARHLIWLTALSFAAAAILLGYTQWSARLISCFDRHDSSWVNRLIAWLGCIRMVCDRPLSGFGWDSFFQYYSSLYLPESLIDGRAVHLNSYLVLAVATGLIAPLLLIHQIGRAILHRVDAINNGLMLGAQLALVALSVGMLTVGGLTSIPYSLVFWTLLALMEADILSAELLRGAEQKRPSLCTELAPFYHPRDLPYLNSLMTWLTTWRWWAIGALGLACSIELIRWSDPYDRSWRIFINGNASQEFICLKRRDFSPDYVVLLYGNESMIVKQLADLRAIADAGYFAAAATPRLVDNSKSLRYAEPENLMVNCELKNCYDQTLIVQKRPVDPASQRTSYQFGVIAFGKAGTWNSMPTHRQLLYIKDKKPLIIIEYAERTNEIEEMSPLIEIEENGSVTLMRINKTGVSDSEFRRAIIAASCDRISNQLSYAIQF